MVAILDYGAGNLTSVRLAFEALHAEAVVTADPHVVRQAQRVVFPGVGAAGSAMDNLRRLHLDQSIAETIARGVPFLGICVGMQVLFQNSEEDGGVQTLGLLPGTVRRFAFPDTRVKVPQMGWNQVDFTRPHPLLDGIPSGTDFYFVHSYYAQPAQTDHILGTTDYAGNRFCSMVARRNLVATQFHAEKSGEAGLRLLNNFLSWDGLC